MDKSHFFALVSRLKNINRWGLMHSTSNENVLEHSAATAMLAYALAAISRDVFGRGVSPECAAATALFHDISEVFTGDMPSPVKYASPEMKKAYKAEEAQARGRLFAQLPPPLRATFAAVLYAEERDEETRRFVKAADKLAAYIKCVGETSAGNREFSAAEKTLRDWLDNECESMPELGWFIDCFLDSFKLSLDELSN